MGRGEQNCLFYIVGEYNYETGKTEFMGQLLYVLYVTLAQTEGLLPGTLQMREGNRKFSWPYILCIRARKNCFSHYLKGITV